MPWKITFGMKANLEHATEGVLGTVDQLSIDNCIMEEVREHRRNLAVAYYDYQKAYDKVHHDWMLRLYKWMGIPANVCQVIRNLMNRWKTRLEIWMDGDKKISRLTSTLAFYKEIVTRQLDFA